MQLVINTHGASLRRKGERFVVKLPKKSAVSEIAATKVTSIVICTHSILSTGAIELATQHNVDICFANRSGEPYSRIWQSRMGSTTRIRREQLKCADAKDGLRIAASWIAKKIENQSLFLAQLRSKRLSHSEQLRNAKASLDEMMTKISSIGLSSIDGDLDSHRKSLMGYEGVAGRVYFESLSKLMPKEYAFHGRSRQPAQDGFNAMLNYSYGIIYSLVERACILAGLDPYIGILHTDNYNKPSLVFDLIEPFRIISERATVMFFTGRRVKSEFFRPVIGGVELAPEGRAALIENMNQRLEKTVRYPVQRDRESGVMKFRRIKLRSTIQHEAHGFANRLLGKSDIPKFVDVEDLFPSEEA
jgi:CRISPR-associated protein Cas1